MLKLLDKSFIELGELENIIQADVSKQDSGSWSVSATVVQQGTLVDEIKRENYVELGGQKFTIRDTVLGREGEKRTVSFVAQHVFHELEEQAVTGTYQLTGTIEQHIQKLLTFQQGSDFYYTNGPDYPGTMYTITRTITINPGSLAENLKRILQQFNARIILDGFAVKPVRQLYVPDSGIILEYSVTNRNITRTLNRDNVITRIIAKAEIPDDDAGKVVTKVKTYGGNAGYRNGITQYMDFGQLTSEVDMDWLAGEYLDVYSDPEASYELEFAELSRLSNIETLFPGRSFAIEVGQGVRILDAELGINKVVPVKSYSYSLTNPAAPSRITLGSFRVARGVDRTQKASDKIDSVIQESTVMKWAETVMDYVHKMIGGTIRDIDPGLLILVQPSGGKKNLKGAAQVLSSIRPGYVGVKYNAPFIIRDPLSEIAQGGSIGILSAYDKIEKYIDATVGPKGASTVVSLINSAYAGAYGAGQSIGYPPDTGASVFGNVFQGGSTELYYAGRVVDELNGRIGNLSGVYLEVGNGGAVGCINSLYGMLNRHDITVSDTAPDNSVGKDGDLWFKFAEEEEG